MGKITYALKRHPLTARPFAYCKAKKDLAYRMWCTKGKFSFVDRSRGAEYLLLVLAGYKEGCYWGVQTDHASNAAQPTYGVYSDVDYEAHTAGCLWRFVAYDEKTTRQFQQVNILSNLLTMGKTRRLNTVRERAVYDNLASDSTDIRRAQRSLRQRMELADFGDLTAHSKFVDLGDISSDAELSQNEASVLNELPVSFINASVRK